MDKVYCSNQEIERIHKSDKRKFGQVQHYMNVHISSQLSTKEQMWKKSFQSVNFEEFNQLFNQYTKNYTALIPSSLSSFHNPMLKDGKRHRNLFH